MDVESLELFLTTFFEVITLFVLIFGLIGLLIPVFPGLVVMWVAILVYAIVQTGLGNMTWVSWLLFALITLLMIGGNISDNIIIAKHVRDKNVPWSSILWSFAAGILVSLFFTPILGILASPLALYLAEWRRLQDKTLALANTKAWMTGWGWSAFPAVVGSG